MIGHDPLIEIIIPNWNGKDMLAHCLSSLRLQTYSSFGVIVIDNGSTDGSSELIESSFPEVRLIRLQHNTGFSVAVNKGIEASTAPWLLLLNNDMEVSRDCLEKLWSATQQYPEYSVFALKMMNYHQRDFIDGAGDAVLRGGVGYRLGTMEKDCHEYQMDRETFGACAGAALYRKDLFTRVGLFDDDFFAYLEDVDLNFRMRRHGLRCMFIAGAIVYHIGSASTGSKINNLTIRLSTRNNIHVLAKNYPLRLLLRFCPAIIIYQVAWLLFCVKKKMLKPWFTGLCQGIRMYPYFYRKGRAIAYSRDVCVLDEFSGMIVHSEREAVRSIMARRTAGGKTNFLLSLYSNFFIL